MAAALDLTANEISFVNVVYSTTSVDQVNSNEAINTFVESEGSASSSSIAIAVAFIVTMLVATTCIGASFGRCWLLGEREHRRGLKVTVVCSTQVDFKVWESHHACARV